MKSFAFKKLIINKAAELIRFTLILALICFLVIKVPTQANQIAGAVGAFILGGSKLRTRFGL